MKDSKTKSDIVAAVSKEMGKPPIELTEEQKKLALDLAAEGKAIKKIREALNISANGMRSYLERYPDYRKTFADARQEGLEELADQLLTIADEESDMLKARLKSENFRWVLSKRKPQIYGDRIDVNLNSTVDIRAALSEAKARSIAKDEDDIFS